MVVIIDSECLLWICPINTQSKTEKIWFLLLFSVFFSPKLPPPSAAFPPSHPSTPPCTLSCTSGIQHVTKETTIEGASLLGLDIDTLPETNGESTWKIGPKRKTEISSFNHGKVLLVSGKVIVAKIFLGHEKGRLEHVVRSSPKRHKM